MKLLIFGGGDLARTSERMYSTSAALEVVILDRDDCDASEFDEVRAAIDAEMPDFIVCTAGTSDIAAESLEEVLDDNLVTAMNVGTAAQGDHIPTVLVASTAGINPGTHLWYGPAKAGVISFVRAMANADEEARIWAVSPGRMDTRMRDADFPDEDPATRLAPRKVASLIIDILDGNYAPGANVVIRKVGLHRVDIYEEVAPCLPSLL